MTILEAPSGGDGYIQLYNQTDGYAVEDSILYTSEVIPTLKTVTLTPGVTTNFETTPKIYTVRMLTTLDGYASICKMAKIEVNGS